MESAKPYIHEMSDEDWDAYKSSGKTWDDARQELLPPDWCGIAGEVIDALGCWSLVSTHSIRCEDDCKKCPEYEQFEQEKEIENA